jgi:protoheme IX farnesyltransferase
MNQSVTLRAAITTLDQPVLASSRSWVAIVSELIKARLTLLVVLTTWVGYYLGSGPFLDVVRMIHTVGGTGMLAAGAAILNQVLERDFDGQMRRTADRPLPAGHITPGVALLSGVGASLGGMAWLLFGVSPLAACLGAITLSTYVFLYTPLKRVTTLNTVIGAIPGALPPLLGWCAATGGWGTGGWALFSILFFWQLPHFMAISWIYRRDYAHAGFRMLSGVDMDGRQTGSSAVRNTLALLVVSLFPFALRMNGGFYLTGALLLGAGFLVCAVRFALRRGDVQARQLFFASIIYLPLLLALLVADKRTMPGGSTSAPLVGEAHAFASIHPPAH